MTHRALATVAGFAAQMIQAAAQEIDALRGFISPTGNVACIIAADRA
jgi:hypothetical protein